MKNVVKKMGFLPFLAILLVGCGSNPPASGNSGGSPSASNSSGGLALDAAIVQAAERMEKAFNTGTEIALISVSSPSAQFSEYVLTYLESILVNNGKLTIVDRANLDKVRAEQGFQLSGDVSDESAKAIGQMLGAGAIVTGTLVNLGDAYRLTLKAISVETARVAASHPADIANSPRVQTLLAGGGGTSGGTRAAQQANTARNTTAAPVAPIQSSPNGSYKAGDKGPAGGLIFYTTDISYFTPPPVNREYQAGQNGPAGGVVFYPAAFIQTPPKVEKEYQIGDTGPGGGIIFYINPQAGEWKYLEAAPASAEFSRNWGLYGKTVRTDVTTGSGQQNTKTITAALENNGEIGAALMCVDLTTGGYKDWFLPSKAELNLMYRNLALKSLGNFKSSAYWSSSESSSGSAWYQHFSDGGQNNWNKDSSHLVRAVRQF